MNKESILPSIPHEKAYYIVGFADGEGSFNTSFRVRNDFLIGWKITPVFNISQKEKTILALIKRYLKCGTIRFRSDGVWAFEVENRTSLHGTIIPFFKKFRFLSEKKKKDFQRFQKILELVEQNKSTTYTDIEDILKLVNEIESKSSRKYTNQEILARAREFWEKNHEKIEKINSLSKK
jgi:hypothetical protein